MAKIAVVEDNDAMRAQLCGFIGAVCAGEWTPAGRDRLLGRGTACGTVPPRFDIIFLDIEMPKLGGMPTAERIRRQDPDVVLDVRHQHGTVCHPRV